VDVKQLIRRLNDFDTDAVVAVGDEGGGWSNIGASCSLLCL